MERAVVRCMRRFKRFGSATPSAVAGSGDVTREPRMTTTRTPHDDTDSPYLTNHSCNRTIRAVAQPGFVTQGVASPHQPVAYPLLPSMLYPSVLLSHPPFPIILDESSHDRAKALDLTL